jgi:hypothetical protein
LVTTDKIATNSFIGYAVRAVSRAETYVHLCSAGGDTYNTRYAISAPFNQNFLLPLMEEVIAVHRMRSAA